VRNDYREQIPKADSGLDPNPPGFPIEVEDAIHG
jgi:hypothetical protein